MTLEVLLPTRTDWGLLVRKSSSQLAPISTGYVSVVLCLHHISGADTFHFRQCVNPHQVRCTAYLLCPRYVKCAIRVAKCAHGQSVQDLTPQTSDQCIQVITDYKATPPLNNNNINFLSKLHNHFRRFEALNTTPARKSTPHADEQPSCLDIFDVRRTLRRVNTWKAAGPNNIPGWVFKECVDEQFAHLLCTPPELTTCGREEHTCANVVSGLQLRVQYYHPAASCEQIGSPWIQHPPV